MIMVVGRIFVDPSDLEEFVSDTQSAASGAESQEGCLFYSFSVENAANGATVFVERWRDEETHNMHRSRAASVQWYEKWSTKIRIEMQMYDLHNERAPI